MIGKILIIVSCKALVLETLQLFSNVFTVYIVKDIYNFMKIKYFKVFWAAHYDQALRLRTKTERMSFLEIIIV